MGEPLITTELENAILRMHYDGPTDQWVFKPFTDKCAGESRMHRSRRVLAVEDEKELNRQASLRVLDVLCDVSREFLHINLGLV